ncbi:MAG TPA: hypothetical protein VGJ21_17140 [Terracidiphilus sp.]|jgi:hypothetical protein
MDRKKLAVVLSMAMSAGVLMAQSDAAQSPAGSGAADQQTQSATASTARARHHEMNPDKAAARLGKKLNLSSDQVAQIKPILADRQQQVQALRADTSLTQDDKRSRMQAIRDDSKTKMEAVMNDQQKQQFEQMLASRRGHRRGNEKPSGL